MSTDPKPEAKGARLFDKRTVDRNIKKGLITRKDYDKHLKTLEDVADKGVYGGPLEEDDDDDILEDEVEEQAEATEVAAGSDGETKA